jgi:hypothetical protein
VIAVVEILLTLSRMTGSNLFMLLDVQQPRDPSSVECRESGKFMGPH